MDIEYLTPAEVVLVAVRAVEARDTATLARVYHPDVEFEWPPGLPYSGRFRGPAIVEMTDRFRAVWQPLQPTTAERRMDPKVVASTEDTVVLEYTWRAVDPAGVRFETSTLARYEVRDGRLRTARMYYWDHAGLIAFLDRAGVDLPVDFVEPTATGSHRDRQ